MAVASLRRSLARALAAAGALLAAGPVLAVPQEVAPADRATWAGPAALAGFTLGPRAAAPS